MAKKCWKKKEKKMRRYFKCDRKEHIAKDCKGKQLMKKQKVQKESEKKDNDDKKKSFGKDLEQIQYERSL